MANYYLDGNSGSDSNSGAEGSPWKTFSGALSKLANIGSAGATLFVKSSASNYNEEVRVTLSGTAAAPFTIKNYPGHSPTIDGRAGVDSKNSGLPSGPLNSLTASDGTGSSFRPMVLISGKYVVWDGINVTRSLGRGIQVYHETRSPEYVTIKNCSVSFTRNAGVMVTSDSSSRGAANRPQHITIENVDCTQAGYVMPYSKGRSTWAHPGAIVVMGGDYCVVRGCHVHKTWTEGIMIDSNQGGSQYFTIEDNVVSDCMSTCIYAHASRYGVVQRNFVYRSVEDKALDQQDGGKWATGWTQGIVISGQERKAHEQFDSDTVAVVNNIVVYQGIGIAIRSTDTRPPTKSAIIANNTLVGNNIGMNLNPPTGTSSGIIVKNNIVTPGANSGATLISGGAYACTFDYNMWRSAPATKFQGGNDPSYADPDLVNASARPTQATSVSDGMSKALNYKLKTTTGPCVNAGQDLSTQLSSFILSTVGTDDGDFFSATSRSGTWDIGADEFGGTNAPVATAAASTNEGNVPLTVNFTGSVSGGTASYSYYWDFGDGYTSTSQNPTHVYESVGNFVATLTVTDANNLTHSDTETVLARTVSTGGAGNVTLEKVVFTAGSASFSVSAQPKAIWFFYGGGITNGTAADDAEFGAGFYTAVNDKQWALGSIGTHNVGTTATAVSVISNNAVCFVNNAGITRFSGSVDSVSSSSVSMSWSGTTASEQIVALCWSGAGVSSVNSDALYIGAQGSSATLSGDMNILFAPGNLRAVDAAFGHMDASIGIALRDSAEAMSLGWASDDNAGTSAQYARVDNDSLMNRPRGARMLDVDSWTSSGATLKLTGAGDVKDYVPVMGMKIEGASMWLQWTTLPWATGNTDYTEASFDPQMALFLMSNLNAANSTATDSTAGAVGVFITDGLVDTSIWRAAKDAAGTTVEKSFVDNQFIILDEDANVVGDGTSSFVTGGLRISMPTTAPGDTYAGILFMVEDTAAGSGPNAQFAYSPATPEAGETVTFTDASEGDGTYTITDYDWDFGDGNTSTSQNPTHSYDNPGLYVVELTVTDDNLATHSISKEINVVVPDDGVLSVTLSAESGQVPLEVTLDASGSTPPTGGEWDEDATQWLLLGENGNSYLLSGITPTVTIDEPDTYSILVTLKTTGYYYSIINEFIEETIFAYSPPDVDFSANYENLTVIGPHSASLYPVVGRDDNVNYVWDYGDNTRSTTLYGTTGVSHTYQINSSIEFNGTSTVIDAGNDTSLQDIHDDAFTFEAWIRLDAATGDDCLVSKQGWYIQSVGGELRAVIQCATTDGYNTTNGEIVQGQWHHIAVTWDDATDDYPAIYVDGVATTGGATQNRSGIVDTDVANNLYIGSYDGSTNFWDGAIAWARLLDEVLYTATFTPPARVASPFMDTDDYSYIAQWGMNEGTGTTVADAYTVNANDGTLANGTWQDLDIHYAAAFNGTTSSINAGSDTSLDNIHDGAMTFEAWVRADSNGEGTGGYIATKGPWIFRISGGKLRAYVNCATTAADAIASAASFSADGEYHHVAFTWDDATYDHARIWVDGLEVTYDTEVTRSGAVVSDAAQDLFIGNNSGGTATFDGAIAWVRISSSVLYTGRFTPPPLLGLKYDDSATVEMWNFTEGDGSTVRASVNPLTNDATGTDIAWGSLSSNYVMNTRFTVEFPEGDSSEVKNAYITIVPTPTAPPSVDEIYAATQDLIDIIAELKKHFGDISDATWVQDGTYTNVYTADLSRAWSEGHATTVREDGVALTEQASIAACNSSAGSYYTSFSSPTLSVSVHPTGSTNPNTNGSEYTLGYDYDIGGALLSDMVAMYEMESSAGAAVPDAHGNASDLVDNNTVQRTTGVDGNAAVLDIPNNRYLTISAANDTEHTILDFTVAFWLYVDTAPTTASTYQLLYHRGGAWGGGFAMEIKYAVTGSPIAFLIYKGDSTSSVVHCSANGPGAGWTFICAYHDSATKTFGIYSDSTGSLVDSLGSPGSYAWTPMTPPYSGGVNVGQQQGASSGVLRMDGLTVFNRALTLPEITWLWNSGSGRAYGDF